MDTSVIFEKLTKLTYELKMLIPLRETIWV